MFFSATDFLLNKDAKGQREIFVQIYAKLKSNLKKLLTKR